MVARIRKVLVPLLVVEIAVGLVFIANEFLRPGCSLLPVTLPSDESRATPGSPERACAVLGRPLPKPSVLPAGMTRAELGIGGPPPSGMPCCRMVYVSYAIEGRNVARMDIHRQDAIPPGNLGDINATLSGVPAVIQQSHIASLQADDVSYLWARDGLLIGLHVLLVGGMSRQVADEMAASIR